MAKQLPTGRGLFIAEKSSTMEDFKKVYDSIKSSLPYSLDFAKFHGHVVELAQPQFYNPIWGANDIDNLPMIPEKWVYVPAKDIDMKTKKEIGPIDKLYLRVKSMIESGGYDFLVCGTDPEREGNLIFDAFISTLEPRFQATKKYRFWNNGTTSTEIEKAFRNLLSYGDVISGTMTVQNLSDAALLRAKMDWLIGLNSTKVMSAKSGFWHSTGRVRNPIEKIIVDRELAIQNFVPEQFFTIKSTFDQNGKTYQGVLTDPETGKAMRFSKKDEAEEVLQSLNGSNAAITSLSKTINRERPKANTENGSLGFFSIDSLQGAAARVFGISKPDSLAAGQSLYEKKITTYARTDSAFITTDDASGIEHLFLVVRKIPELAQVLTPQSDQLQQFLKNKKYVNNSEVRGHSAILPLPGDNFDYNSLTDTEKKILYLVARSVVLPFLPDRVVEKTKVETTVGDKSFRTTGSVLLDEGWSAIVPEFSSRDVELPDLNEGEVIKLSDEIKEGWTTPPERYDVDSLGSVLVNVHRLLLSDEEKLAMQKAEGLGRPSTRTTIIQSLIDLDRITCSGKKQVYGATPFGIETVQNLKNSEITSPHLTAKWEIRLQEVEDGLVNADQVYNEIVQYTELIVKSLSKLNVSFSEIPSYARKDAIAQFKDGSKVYKSASGAYYDEEFQSWMAEKNEAEKEGYPVPPFRGFYLQSMLDNAKMKFKTKLSDKEVKTMVEGGQVEKEIIWKEFNNQTSKKLLELGADKRMNFVKTQSSQTVEEFNVGNTLIVQVDGEKDKKKYRFYLIGGRDSEIQVYGYVANRLITQGEFGSLLQGNELQVDDLINKKGEKFPGTLFFNKSSNRIEIKFAEVEKDVLFSDPGLMIEKRKSKSGDYYFLVNGVYVPLERSGHRFSLDELIILGKTNELAVSDLWSEKKQKNYAAVLYFNNGKLEQRFE